ncbi:MAG: extracellular solute-binding protein [Lautropia sp.]|nr:extracellular solute-binding protein [Lautropia sp.]
MKASFLARIRRQCRASRLDMLLSVALATTAGLTATPVWAAHGMAWGGTPRYPAEFQHFDYVNPNAPKAGLVSLDGFGTFDKLNPFTLRGLAAAGISTLMFESLAEASWDEPFSVYGLLAEDMVLAPDGLSILFKLRAEARFNNGDPVLAKDVKHAFEQITGPKAHPLYRHYFEDIDSVDVVDERIVRFNFKRVNPELHLIIAKDLPIFSHKWGGGKPFDQIVQDEPITSGPYQVDAVDYGRRISYRRRDDYWGAELPVRRGMFNFNRVTYKYFKDETARLEGFKAGEFDWLSENSARNWARGHVGARYRSGELLQRSFPHSNVSGMQGFALNQRRPLFQDGRVRHALALAFDFEWLNRQVFYGQYSRTRSYFANSVMAATGEPDAEERAFLESLKAPISPEVLGPVPDVPASPDARALRENLKKAQQLLADAGWRVGKDGLLRNADGKRFSFELLSYSPTLERVASPWVHNLARLGIQVRLRTVDPALYQKRMHVFDFDATTASYPMSSTPGNELRLMLGSAALGQDGSGNYAGVADPVVDEIIDYIVRADSRERLNVATRALDRVLRHGWYMVPQYHISSHRVAFDYRLHYPSVLPLFYEPTGWMLQTWWFDGTATPIPPALEEPALPAGLKSQSTQPPATVTEPQAKP